jgi:putative transposase
VCSKQTGSANKIFEPIRCFQAWRDGVSEQIYYRWCKEYGGMRVSQVRRFKNLEKKNIRLKRAVADLTLDKLILKEALEGNY